MDYDRYSTLLRRRSQHRRNLDYLQEQAAAYGVLAVPLHLHNAIQAEQAAIEQVEEELEQVEQTLDAANLPPSELYRLGEAWRAAAGMVADAAANAATAAAGRSTTAGAERLRMALAWLDELRDRIHAWYMDHLDSLYLDDFFDLDPADPNFAQELDRVKARFDAMRPFIYRQAHDAQICDDLRHLVARFDSDLRPLIGHSADADRISDALGGTLAGEQMFVHESAAFVDLLTEDLRAMQRGLRRGDPSALQAAQETAYGRIASLRSQVGHTLRQLSDARAALRAALEPIGS